MLHLYESCALDTETTGDPGKIRSSGPGCESRHHADMTSLGQLE